MVALNIKHFVYLNAWSSVAHMVAAGFLFHYLSGPTPYNYKYNVLSALLNKTCPSFVDRVDWCHCFTSVEQIKCVECVVK